MPEPRILVLLVGWIHQQVYFSLVCLETGARESRHENGGEESWTRGSLDFRSALNTENTLETGPVVNICGTLF